MSYIRTLQAIITMLLVTEASYAASINRNETTQIANGYAWSCDVKIAISGRLQEGDFEKIVAAIEDSEKSCPAITFSSNSIFFTKIINLDSGGGSVNESLKIGRLIRNKQWKVTVSENERCYSACVFVLAASVDKDVKGKIGIHRPYLENTEATLTLQEVSEIRKARKEMLREYLEEIDIPTSLLDTMDAFPPDEIKILTKDELKTFRLIGLDPNYDELIVAKLASQFGLTSSEYRRRLAKSKNLCTDTDPYCNLAAILETSSEEAKLRQQSVFKICFSNGKRQDNCATNIYKNGIK